jgi:hypothetical protein
MCQTCCPLPIADSLLIFLVETLLMQGRSSATIFRIIVAIVAWFALILQQYILIDNTPGNGLTPLGAVWRFFIYFTILANLFVAISLTVVAIAPSSSAGRFFSKPSVIAGIGVYIFIVGLVYNIALRKIWNPIGRDRLADELLHVAVPLLYVLYWLIYASKKGLQWKHVFYWLSVPALYIVYALLRGSTEGFYAYYFINLDELGAQKVLLNSIVLLAAFVVIGCLFVAIGKRLERR